MKTEILKAKQKIKIDWSKPGQLVRQFHDEANIVMTTGEHDEKHFEGILIAKSKHYNEIIGHHDEYFKQEDYELITEPIHIKFIPDPIKIT